MLHTEKEYRKNNAFVREEKMDLEYLLYVIKNMVPTKDSSAFEESDRYTKFTTTSSMKEALDRYYYNTALPEDNGLLGKKICGVKNTLGFLPTITYDYAGDEVDINRFLTGEPEHFMNMKMEERKSGNAVNIYITAAFSGDIESKVIVKYGKDIFSLYQILIRKGYSVNLIGLHNIKGNDRSNWNIEIKIKDSSDFLDLRTLFFVITNPSFLRRFIFAYEESHRKELRTIFRIGNGYGSSVDFPYMKEEQEKHYFSFRKSQYGIEKFLEEISI